MKFKIGEVVKTASGKKGVVLQKYIDKYTYDSDFNKNNYVVAFIGRDGYRSEFNETELSKTKDKPFKVLKADRKDSTGYVDHTFYFAFLGKKTILTAGCRFFTSLKTAKKHWGLGVDNWDGWDSERVLLNNASLKIIDRFEKKMKG